MKIFYDKATGEPIGSIDGFDDNIAGMSLSTPGVDVGELHIGIGHEHEELARRVMEPADSLGLFDLKIDESGRVMEKTPMEIKQRQDKEKAARDKNEAHAKANPPRDFAKEIDDLHVIISKLQGPKSK